MGPEAEQELKEIKRLEQNTLLLNLAEEAERPGALTANQLDQLKTIMDKIPSEAKPYIQHGVTGLLEVKKSYADWICKGRETKQKAGSEGRPPLNEQGIQWVPDFPEVKIHIQGD
jgi:hypothetical protein